MDSSCLPSSVPSSLATFRPCFTAPSFERLVAVVCGWIPCPGVHMIGRALVAAGVQGPADKGTAPAPASCPRRAGASTRSAAAGRPLHPCLPPRVEAAADDTLYHRTGPQLCGAGMHRDAATSTYGGAGSRRASFAFGHDGVVLSGGVPLPWNGERGIAIPVLLRLRRAKKRYPKAPCRPRSALTERRADDEHG